MNDRKFIKELKAAGANKDEVKELLALGKALEKTPAPQLSSYAKKAIAREIGFKSSFVFRRPALSGALAFMALLLSLTVFAQTAQPGDPLYALKRGSEEVRKVVQPGFDDDDIQKIRDDENRKKDDDIDSSSGSGNSSSDDQGRTRGRDNDDRSSDDDKHQEDSDDKQDSDDRQRTEDDDDNSGSGSSNSGSSNSDSSNDDDDKDILGTSSNSGSGSNKSGSNSGSGSSNSGRDKNKPENN